MFQTPLRASLIQAHSNKNTHTPAAKQVVCVSNKTKHYCPVSVFNCTLPGHVFKLSKTIYKRCNMGTLDSNSPCQLEGITRQSNILKP